MSSSWLIRPGVLSCPDPEHCRGWRLRYTELERAVYGLDLERLPCPAAYELHLLRSEPVGPRAVEVVATADRSRLAPGELVDLLALTGRVAVWAQQQRDDLAVTVSDLAKPIKLHGEDGPVLVAEPGAADVGVALHLSPGAAKSLLRRTRARRIRAPKLVEALRTGDSSHAHAFEVDKACADLSDEAAAGVAEACERPLLQGTKQQVVKALAKAVTIWHCEHPEPEEEPLPGVDPPPLLDRDRRTVESFASRYPGMAYVLTLLPTEDAAALMARLEDGAKRVKATGDPRTLDQIAADLLAQFGWHGLPHDDLLSLLAHINAEADTERADTERAAAEETGSAESAESAEAAGSAGSAESPVDPYAGFWGPADTADPGPADAVPADAGEPPPTDDPAEPAGSEPPPRSTPRPPLAPRDPETGLTAAQLALLTALTGQVRAQVHATVSVETLLGIREHLAEIATAGPGYRGTDLGPVPPEVARALAARPDALWDRYVHDQNGVLQGVSPSYVVPDTLRRTVLAEYVTCTFYGCPRPAAECDADHVTDWADGGHTAHANLGPADRGHHNLKTHGGWQLARDTRGRMTWTSPFGQTVTTDPHDYRPRPRSEGWT